LICSVRCCSRPEELEVVLVLERASTLGAEAEELLGENEAAFIASTCSFNSR
jgi:hypothetical protein